ncbi:MAG: PD-(D/E)XK nuclease-like domain-containing protein [Desulfovibrionaceae bacterium]
MLNLNLQDTGSLVQAGLIPGIPIEDYHKGPGTSKSQLDQVARTVAHYLSSLTIPRKETDAMKIGSHFHTMVLEPEKQNFVVGPDVNKNTNIWKAFKADAEAAGQTIIDQATLDMLNGMVASVKAHPAASALLFDGDGINESSAYWYDKTSGLLCRCRPDRYRRDLNLIVDLKTTGDASPEAFAKSVADFRYHVQAPFYSDGVTTATGQEVRGFVFVVVEKTPPYAVAVYQLDEQAMEEGHILYHRDLMRLSEAKCSGIWTAYSDRIETISLPRWAIKETRSYE